MVIVYDKQNQKVFLTENILPFPELIDIGVLDNQVLKSLGVKPGAIEKKLNESIKLNSKEDIKGGDSISKEYVNKELLKRMRVFLGSDDRFIWVSICGPCQHMRANNIYANLINAEKDFDNWGDYFDRIQKIIREHNSKIVGIGEELFKRD